MNTEKRLQSEKKNQKWADIILGLFVVLTFLIITYSSRDKQSYFEDGIRTFNTGWKQDYSEFMDSNISNSMVLPIKVTNHRTDGVHMTNTIPEGVSEGEYIFVSGYHQDMQVWIEGRLVENYSNIETRLFGLTSASVTIMVPLCPEDSGKKIEIVYSSYYESFECTIREVMIGTQSQFYGYLLKNFGGDLYFGLIFIVIGILWVIFYIFIYIRGKRKTNVIYLGCFAIMIGFWALFNSRMRQFYLSDVFMADKMSYLLMASFVIPCMKFINGRQQKRYQKGIYAICYLMTANAMMMLLLDILGIVDMAVSQKSTHFLILIASCYTIATMLIDLYRGYWCEMAEAMIGLLVLTCCALLKVATIFVIGVDSEITNMFLYMGGVFMVMVMGVGNIKSWMDWEKQTQIALQTSEIKSEFLANMSHEIRTPITAVLGMNELILREKDLSTAKGYAVKIKNAGAILLSIVNDILDYSKIEAGKMKLMETEYSVVHLLNDVVSMVKIKLDGKDLEFKTQIDETIPKMLYGDGMKLQQILINLLGNAVKYTKKGQITLKIQLIQPEAAALRISVADTGIGIREEEISKLSESFTRLDEKSNYGIQGTGLGMSITMKYLQMMGSSLEVKSIYGKGSEFSFEVIQKVVDSTPIGNYEREYKRLGENYLESGASFIAPQARVLVVDDNEMNLEVITGLLKDTEIQVTAVDRGFKAVELFRSYSYDLVLLDHRMPGMDGIETLQKLRSIEDRKLRKTPMIALTANALSGARKMYIEKGFCDYLSKPIDIEELERTLVKYLPADMITIIANTKTKSDKAKNVFVMQDAKAENDRMLIEEFLVKYGINVKDGLRYLAGRADKYKVALAAYVKYDKGRRKHLEQLINDNDIENYTIEIHALKSNAKAIGANNLAEIAWRQEQSGKEKNMEYIIGDYDILITEMDLIIQGIKELLNSNLLTEQSDKEQPEEPPMVMEQHKQLKVTKIKDDMLKKQESEVVHMIMNYDRKAAMTLLSVMLERVQGNRQEVERYEKIYQYLDEFEFEEAMEVIMGIAK